MAKAKGIYKRGSVYWIRYAGTDGNIVYESSGSDKFKDAEALLIQRKQSVKEGKQPEIKRTERYTFNQLANQYLQWAERQRSFISKKGFIKQLLEAFGQLPLNRINTMVIEQFQTERLQNGNKPATVNRLIATLKHAFTKGSEWSMVNEETIKRIRKVKLLEENNRRLRYLSLEECINLISHCTDHTRDIVITAMNTGMRKSEILGLKWSNVDLKQGFILLEKTKNGDRREIPINATLKNMLSAITRRLDVPYVFYDKVTGKAFGDIKRSFHTACRKAGIKDFHFHDLRHTFASHLVMAGVDLTTVKELLGHKTLTMTLRYAHLAPSHKVKAVDILDKSINKKTNYTKTIQL